MPAKNYDVKLGSEAVIKTQKSKREKAGSGAFFSGFARQLAEVSNTVSKHQLEELRAILHKAHSRRFKQRSEPKYGSMMLHKAWCTTLSLKCDELILLVLGSLTMKVVSGAGE